MKISKDKAVGHLASAATYIIFGVNIIACRDIATDGGLSPIVLFSIRALVAGMLFWIVSLIVPREKVPAGDLLKIAAAGIIGIMLPQLTFLHAVARTTPVDLSIITTITPILTMLFAAVFLKEPITWKKVSGVAVSFGGILWLILQSTAVGGGAATTQPLGIVYCIANCAIFAFYLGSCRPLIRRYSSVTLMKWMFLVSFIVTLPFSWRRIAVTDFVAVPRHVWWEVAFLVFFATFVAYFLIPIGQKRIRPTLVSMYGYLQPIIAIGVAIATGMDSLTLTKVAAAILVFVGVYVVTQSRAAS
jgi:drug/metabolite transporter (DMT)-like permease